MKTLGLFLNSTEENYGQDLIQGAREACKVRGVRLLCISGGTLESARGSEAMRNVLYELFQSGSLDGLLLAGSLSHTVKQEALQEFASLYRIPLVTISVKLPGFHGVITDARNSLFELVDHLVLDHGFKRFGFIGGPLGQQEAELRYAVCSERIKELGATLVPEMVGQGDFTEASGHEAMVRLLGQYSPIDALICASDNMALGAIDALRERGIGVPSEMAVTGFDDIIEGRFLEPTLTTIKQSAIDQARAGAECAMDLMEGLERPLQVTVPSRFVIRRSCTCNATLGLTMVSDRWCELAAARFPIQAWHDLNPQDPQELDDFFSKVRQWCMAIDTESTDPADAWKLVHANLAIDAQGIKNQILNHCSSTVLDYFLKQGLQQQVQLSKTLDRIRNIRESLLSTFNLPDILELLGRELPYIGYPTIWLSLFGKHANKLLESRLHLHVCPSRGILVQDTKGQAFPTKELIPGGLAGLQDTCPLLIMEALYTPTKHLGYIIMESPLHLSLYTDTLRTQISGALHGYLLLEEKDHAVSQLVDAEKSQALGNLVAGIAHEVNTPLGVALSAISYLHNRINELKTNFAAGTLKRSSLETLIGQLLESSHILDTNLVRAAGLIASFKQVSADQASEARRTFTITEYIQESINSLHPKLKRNSHISVSVHGPAGLEVDSYPGALAQIISNLVLNTLIHAFEPESIGTCTITVENHGPRIQITCTDNGKGIPAEHIGHIFEPFFTTKRGQGGTGLGLHIIQNLVNKVLGGTIKCQSIEGVGTSFTITIPQKSPTPASVP